MNKKIPKSMFRIMKFLSKLLLSKLLYSKLIKKKRSNPNYFRKKLKSKHLDLIIANHLSNAGKSTTAIQIISDKAEPLHLEGDKFELAHLIIDRILKL